MENKRARLVVEEMTNPSDVVRTRAQDDRFRRNSDWLQAHVTQVYERYRGKCICVSAQQLFVADTPEAVLALAKAAHPEDDGRLLRYIPSERMTRIYAHSR
jgi:hypothetical protein